MNGPAKNIREGVPKVGFTLLISPSLCMFRLRYHHGSQEVYSTCLAARICGAKSPMPLDPGFLALTRYDRMASGFLFSSTQTSFAESGVAFWQRDQG